MAITALEVAWAGWLITMVGWFLSPVITLLLPKIISFLGFDLSEKLNQLEIRVVPELQKALRAVDQERMLERGEAKRAKSDVAVLDKMAAMLRHAREDAEDIFDDAQEIEMYRNRCWQQLCGAMKACIVVSYGAMEACIARCLGFVQKQLDELANKVGPHLDGIVATCKSSCMLLLQWAGKILNYGAVMLIAVQWPGKILSGLRSAVESICRMSIAGVTRGGLARLLQWTLRKPGPQHVLPVTTVVVVPNRPVPVVTNGAASDQPIPETALSEYFEGAISDRLAPVTATVAASDRLVPVTTTPAVSVGPSHEPVPVTTSAAASDEPIQVTAGATTSDESPAPVTAPSESWGWFLSCLCSFFNFINNWFGIAAGFVCFLRDWPYEERGVSEATSSEKAFFQGRSIHNPCSNMSEKLGITFASWEHRWHPQQQHPPPAIADTENATALDFFVTIISRRNLKKRIEKVESTVSEVKKSPLISEASKSAQEDIANKNRSRIRIASNHKVFGREALRDSIMENLRETPHSDAPSSSASPCYSVIGIYGVAGSGKTTFARYIRDYIEEECKEKLFDTIMCIHVSETFSVDDIFHDMLKDITKKRQSGISDREELKEKLEESLRGKRFFLILDDLWVNNKNDRQLKELISPLNVGLKGSKILVTAQTKVAAGALCIDEPKEIPDMDEDQYFSMFMHYAGGTSADDKEFKRVGRVIAEKLHGSPIAAVIVAGRLGANRDIGFWKNTAELDMLNDTMDALWWSYQHLSMDIRRCFEYCNIFPRRFKMKKENLVHLWIAHGFVKSSCAREDMEDVAEGYIQELVSYSFLQPEGTSSDHFWYRIHDLLHDLADMVTGTYYSRIENQSSQRGEGWKEDVPRDVRHLFIQCYDAKLITEKIIGLENLHTLVIYVVEEDTPVEEKVIEYICKRLLKLRVLAISFSNGFHAIKYPKSLLIPKSISRLKHLRYLSLRTSRSYCRVILPKTLNKLKYVQVLDFGGSEICGFNFANLITLRHIICSCMKSSNIGMLISLQTMKHFRVSNKQGYGLQQLRNLNKLRGTLGIDGLENVKSKEEADEANIAAKKRLAFLSLWWDCDINRSCSPSDVQAEVLEGLYPPMGLQRMMIHGYEGLRYPDWMVGKQNCGPKDLQELWFSACTQMGRAPEFVEAFPHLRMLRLWFCKWDTLPDNMEHLTSLKKLEIMRCLNIWSLPTLPQSLEEFHLSNCNDEFMKSCKTVGHPNYQKIKHISRKMIEGETPLIHEARLGPLETTEYLLDHGTNPSIESNMGATALHHAAGIGHIELMKLLLGKGVDVESESDAGTPLVWAAGHGQQEAVKLLLEHNAKPNNETADGITSLVSAIFAGSLPCLEVLIQAGANPNVTAGGATPMHIAADSGNLEIIKCLLQAGGDPNTSDDDELKPIQVAALSDNLEVVEHLLPLTSPIPGVSNWTVDGIVEYTLSKISEEKAQVSEAASLQRREPAEVSPEAKKRSLEAKSRGHDAFRRKDFLVAVDAYTQAIEFDPNEAALFSNRSLCWLRAGQGECALEDARACRALRPDWAKACFREGAALRFLQRFDEAANAFYEGVQLKPENKELVNAFREAVEDRRRFHDTDKPANGTQSE